MNSPHGKWVIGWFIDGLGTGWLGGDGPLPWTGDVEQATQFDTEADADRMLIEMTLKDLDVDDLWVEPLTKVEYHL